MHFEYSVNCCFVNSYNRDESLKDNRREPASVSNDHLKMLIEEKPYLVTLEKLQELRVYITTVSVYHKCKLEKYRNVISGYIMTSKKIRKKTSFGSILNSSFTEEKWSLS